MKEQSLQYIVNEGFRRIVDQGKPGWDSDKKSCVYLSPKDNSMCFVGIMSNKKAMVNLGDKREHYNVYDVYSDELLPSIKGFSAYGDVDTYEELQRVHDSSSVSPRSGAKISGAAFISKFRKKMRQFAVEYSLNTKVIDTYGLHKEGKG